MDAIERGTETEIRIERDIPVLVVCCIDDRITLM